MDRLSSNRRQQMAAEQLYLIMVMANAEAEASTQGDIEQSI